MSNTSPRIIANIDARQAPKYVYFTMTLAALVAAGNVISVDLPEGVEVIDGAFQVVTATNTTGTDTATVGDSAVANRYLAATNLKATSRTALTLTGFVTTPSNKTLLITRTPADAAATVGEVKIYVGYVKANRSDSTQG